MDHDTDHFINRAYALMDSLTGNLEVGDLTGVLNALRGLTRPAPDVVNGGECHLFDYLDTEGHDVGTHLLRMWNTVQDLVIDGDTIREWYA